MLYWYKQYGHHYIIGENGLLRAKLFFPYNFLGSFLENYSHSWDPNHHSHHHLLLQLSPWNPQDPYWNFTNQAAVKIQSWTCQLITVDIGFRAQPSTPLSEVSWQHVSAEYMTCVDTWVMCVWVNFFILFLFIFFIFKNCHQSFVSKVWLVTYVYFILFLT